VKFNAEAKWLSFSHRGLLVLCNLSAQPQAVPKPEGLWELVLRSDAPGGALLPAHATHVYTLTQCQ
jgi:hypothetical protein